MLSIVHHRSLYVDPVKQLQSLDVVHYHSLYVDLVNQLRPLDAVHHHNLYACRILDPVKQLRSLDVVHHPYSLYRSCQSTPTSRCCPSPQSI